MKYVVLAGLFGLLFFGGMMMRKRRGQTLETSNKRLDSALEDFDGRLQGLRHKAETVSGEARQKLQEQVHELEAKQKELRGKLEEIGTEAKKVLERARA
jgi:chromosome segregation ATPase